MVSKEMILHFTLRYKAPYTITLLVTTVTCSLKNQENIKSLVTFWLYVCRDSAAFPPLISFPQSLNPLLLTMCNTTENETETENSYDKHVNHLWLSLRRKPLDDGYYLSLSVHVHSKLKTPGRPHSPKVLRWEGEIYALLQLFLNITLHLEYRG